MRALCDGAGGAPQQELRQAATHAYEALRAHRRTSPYRVDATRVPSSSGYQQAASDVTQSTGQHKESVAVQHMVPASHGGLIHSRNAGGDAPERTHARSSGSAQSPLPGAADSFAAASSRDGQFKDMPAAMQMVQRLHDTVTASQLPSGTQGVLLSNQKSVLLHRAVEPGTAACSASLGVAKPNPPRQESLPFVSARDVFATGKSEDVSMDADRVAVSAVVAMLQSEQDHSRDDSAKAAPGSEDMADKKRQACESVEREAQAGLIICSDLDLELLVAKRQRLIELSKQVLDARCPGFCARASCSDDDYLREASCALADISWDVHEAVLANRSLRHSRTGADGSADFQTQRPSR